MIEQTESAALSATTSRNIDSILIAVEEAALAMRRGDTQQYRSHYSDLKHTLLPALAASHPSAPEGQALSDEAIKEWGDRHDLGISSISELRAVFEDAQTLYMTVNAGEVKA